MNLVQSKYHFLSRRSALCRTLAAFSLVLASTATATAQEGTYIDFSHPNVMIDLSVIDGGGYQDASGAAATVPGRSSGLKLLMPGNKSPVSMLHVPTVSGKPLSLPKKQKTVQTARKTPDPVMKEAPAPAPVVKQTPQPAPKPIATSTTPKKLEAPKKPATAVVVAATAPPAPAVPKAPPPVDVKPAPKVAATEAPKAPTPPPVAKTQNIAAPQQAALPQATETIASGQALRITFGADKTKLPDAAKAELIALAEKMKGQKDMRLQLMAYAGGPSLSSSLARRMSLSRALSIRSFLIESGVRSTRIDVRALGNKTKEEPINRVDLNVTER